MLQFYIHIEEKQARFVYGPDVRREREKVQGASLWYDQPVICGHVGCEKLMTYTEAHHE